MRIRTDGEHAWRETEIEGLAEFYGVNKTSAILRACEDVPALVDALEDVLDRDDLTARQRQEIARRFSRAPGVDVELQDEISVTPT